MAKAKILLVFDGHEDGLVERMSRKVAEGAREAGAEVLMLTAANATPDDAIGHDALIIGSPCHFAGPSTAVKRFMDSTWPARGRLAGKIGGAFTAANHLAGGHELTLISAMTFFLSHGMIIEGNTDGDAFGATLIAPEGDAAEAMTDDPEECRRLGRRVAELAARLKG